jgi:transposase
LVVLPSLSTTMEAAMAQRRGRPTAQIALSDEEREVLERWARRPKSAQALALRCRIVLAAAEGATNQEIAARLRCHPTTVGKWRNRFAELRVDGLHDEPRPGKPRTISDADVERVIVTTLEETPPDATHWSTRSMAKRSGMSQTAIRRIWAAFGLKPHLSESFKLSPDPQFIDKVRDIVGLYLNPPDAAVVLCVDEKSQIQALDRTAPVLPLLPGVAERRSHDYRRNGTTNLYAALDVASGNVISSMTDRHRSQEFLRFLRLIDTSVPEHLDVHVVLDNSSTHKTPAVQRWLLRHPRFVLHFTPTYSSWLNLVERWFAELTTKWLRRGTHRSVRELVASIRTWITNWNDDPKPFVWHKPADEILASLAAYCQRITGSGH